MIRDFMLKVNGEEMPLTLFLSNNDYYINNETLIEILKLKVGEKIQINDGSVGINEYQRTEDLDN